VLLVEDDPIEARLAEAGLALETRPEFLVERAGTLSEARARLAGGGYDVVLLDLLLPDAQDAATVEGALAAAPGVPIVVHTGEDDLELAADLVRRGADDVLVKGGPGGRTLARALVLAVARRRRSEHTQRG